MKMAPGKFKVLPAGEATASDEALFARVDFIESNAEAINILVEELVKVWRRINADPFYVIDERKRLGLLADLPKELEEEVVPYYTLSAEGGMFPPNGGGAMAAKVDFDFFSAAGQLKGKPEDLNVDDFWYLAPLHSAPAKLGTVDIYYSAP